ncbi:MAG: LysR substrate-binding domain-containing protein [Novosphingobium sp.]
MLNQAPMADSVTPFIAQHVYQQRVSLIGRPYYGKPGATLADLLGEHPVILPTLESGVRSQFEALVARLGITPQIAAEVDDMAMMRLLAREGAGLLFFRRSSSRASSRPELWSSSMRSRKPPVKAVLRG